MRKKTIILYTFEELNDQAKKQVIEDNRYINVEDGFWYEGIIDEFKEKLEGLGYTNPEIEFDGFGIQGAGASYTSGFDNSTDNLYRLLPALKNVRPEVFQIIQDSSMFNLKRQTYQYSHENTVEVEYYLDVAEDFSSRYSRVEELITDLLNELAEAMNNERVTLCNELYNQLEDQYFMLISDEVVAQSLIDAELEFVAADAV